jgi:hypothetical protein
MNQDQLKNVSFTLQAVVVVPSNTVDLATPGQLFLDEASAEGVVKVDLLKGGTCVFAITKAGGIPCCPIVKRVYVLGTTATGIFVNPLAQ